MRVRDRQTDRQTDRRLKIVIEMRFSLIRLWRRHLKMEAASPGINESSASGGVRCMVDCAYFVILAHVLQRKSNDRIILFMFIFK